MCCRSKTRQIIGEDSNHLISHVVLHHAANRCRILTRLDLQTSDLIHLTGKIQQQRSTWRQSNCFVSFWRGNHSIFCMARQGKSLWKSFGKKRGFLFCRMVSSDLEIVWHCTLYGRTHVFWGRMTRTSGYSPINFFLGEFSVLELQMHSGKSVSLPISGNKTGGLLHRPPFAIFSRLPPRQIDSISIEI